VPNARVTVEFAVVGMSAGRPFTALNVKLTVVPTATVSDAGSKALPARG
jgi:hypothetical protein